MNDEDYPGLYRAADRLSQSYQRIFFYVLGLHLGLLIFGAMLSAAPISKAVAITQIFSLLGALFCSIYLFGKRPDRLWYVSRAVAESVKTITWKFVCRAEPFNVADAAAQHSFHDRLKKITEQNTEATQRLSYDLTAHQITAAMNAIRQNNLDFRMKFFRDKRIDEQLSWYAKKAEFNRKRSTRYFLALILMNALAVLFAVLRLEFVQETFWYTDIAVAAAASLLTWIQAKRYSELSASYTLTAVEIGIIREQSDHIVSEHAFSAFVGDTENAFSREHTQWIARKDR